MALDAPKVQSSAAGGEFNAIVDSISQLAALVGMRFVINNSKIKEFDSLKSAEPKRSDRGKIVDLPPAAAGQ
jgi:hypothetical protein